jgi:outer membrane protein assembly factor BamB/tRNA A-37 threonylcarbamoyl transferase component Bud32
MALSRKRISNREETLPKGTILQERYEILDVIGVGGMGAVYRARDLRFPKVTKLCAVKEIKNTASDPRLRRMAVKDFEREANILATLSHPSIPKVFDYFSDEDRSYLVLEFIRGKDLEAILEESRGFLPEEKIIDWAIQICDVLSYLHNYKPDPIVFRDLKPSNIMVNDYNQIILVDFGIARIFQVGERGTVIGTEGYAPPEQYRGLAGPRGDIYALGATLHHLLTKRDPRFEPPFSFHERPIRSINPSVSEELEAIVMKALEYDMEKRFSSALEMKEALQEIVPGGPPRFALAFITPQEGVESIWRFSCKEEVRSSPAITGGVVYIGSYDKNLYALDAKTGSLIWKYPTEGGICSSPCVWRDKVIFGSEDRILYSIYTRTGRIAWSCPTQDRIRSSPRVEYEHIFFGSDDHNLYAVKAENGRVVWKFEAMLPIRSSPFVAEEVVYFGSDDNHVYALDVHRGEMKWRFHTGRGVLSSPLVYEGMVYVGSMDWSFYALDARYGWAVWRYRTGGPIVSSPAQAFGLLYFGSVDGNLYALEAKRGRLVWKFATDGQVTSSPSVAEGAIYFGSVDSYVYSLDAKTGKLRWRFKTGGPIVSSPKVVEGVVYIGSTDNNIYALAV